MPDRAYVHGVLRLREEAPMTREELAMDLLQTLGLANETQTDDVDAEQVAEVLAALDAAREIAQSKLSSDVPRDQVRTRGEAVSNPTPPPIFDADELRALATNATPGPWNREMIELGNCGPMTIGVGSKGPPICIMNGIVESPRGNRDASYVASVSPEVLLALLDERATLLARVEAAEAERDRLKRELEDEIRELQRGGMSWAEATGSEGDDS